MGLKRAIRSLPEGYELLADIDLSKNVRLLVFLTLASLVLFILTGLGLSFLMPTLRPDLIGVEISLAMAQLGFFSFLGPILILIGVTVVMIVLHEAIHGIVFMLITGGKVTYGFKGTHAYAAAPGWFIPRNPYLLVTLAPLVVITLVGLLVVLWVPIGWVLPIALLVSMNAAGAVGDLYMFFWLLSRPADVLIQDFGDRMEISAPAAISGETAGS